MKTNVPHCENCRLFRSLDDQVRLSREEIKQVESALSRGNNGRFSPSSLKAIIADFTEARSTEQMLKMVLQGQLDIVVDSDGYDFVLNEKGRAALPQLVKHADRGCN